MCSLAVGSITNGAVCSSVRPSISPCLRSAVCPGSRPEQKHSVEGNIVAARVTFPFSDRKFKGPLKVLVDDALVLKEDCSEDADNGY